MTEHSDELFKPKRRSSGVWFIVALMVVMTAVLIWRPAASGDGFHAPADRKPPGSMVLDTLDGKPWKLEDHLGKVVVMNFWATWCPPCVAETPALVRIATRYAGADFAMVGVSFDEGPPETVVNFVASHQIPYPIVRPTAMTPTIEAMTAIPVTMLIDRQGRVARTWIGEISETELMADIERLGAEAHPPSTSP